jgi:hypothetical protein
LWRLGSPLLYREVGCFMKWLLVLTVILNGDYAERRMDYSAIVDTRSDCGDYAEAAKQAFKARFRNDDVFVTKRCLPLSRYELFRAQKP